jgi:hypothetical protein
MCFSLSNSLSPGILVLHSRHFLVSTTILPPLSSLDIRRTLHLSADSINLADKCDYKIPTVHSDSELVFPSLRCNWLPHTLGGNPAQHRLRSGTAGYR